MSEVLQFRRDGRVLHLALNRPEKRNALNAVLCADLTAALVEAEHDPEIGAILLTGYGKGFSAGMDLDEALTADAGMLADVQERLFTAYTWLTKPLIAAVQGAALAGGTGLAANAHIVIAAEDATFLLVRALHVLEAPGRPEALHYSQRLKRKKPSIPTITPTNAPMIPQNAIVLP